MTEDKLTLTESEESMTPEDLCSLQQMFPEETKADYIYQHPKEEWVVGQTHENAFVEAERKVKDLKQKREGAELREESRQRTLLRNTAKKVPARKTPAKKVPAKGKTPSRTVSARKDPSNWAFYKEIDPVLSLVECPKCHNKGAEWLCSGYEGNPVIGIQCLKCLSLLTEPFGLVLKKYGLEDTADPEGGVYHDRD